jgi:hypothetical protein
MQTIIIAQCCCAIDAYVDEILDFRHIPQTPPARPAPMATFLPNHLIFRLSEAFQAGYCGLNMDVGIL